MCIYICPDIFIVCATCSFRGSRTSLALTPLLVATTALVANQAAAGAVGGISAGSVLLAFANLLATPARIEVPSAQTRELSAYDTTDSEPEQRSYLSYASRENLCFYFLGLITGPTIETIQVFRLLLRKVKAWLNSQPVRRAIPALDH